MAYYSTIGENKLSQRSHVQPKTSDFFFKSSEQFMGFFLVVVLGHILPSVVILVVDIHSIHHSSILPFIGCGHKFSIFSLKIIEWIKFVPITLFVT